MNGTLDVLGRELGRMDEHEFAFKLRQRRAAETLVHSIPAEYYDEEEIKDIFREGDLARLRELAKKIPDHLERMAKLNKWNEARWGHSRGGTRLYSSK